MKTMEAQIGVDTVGGRQLLDVVTGGGKGPVAVCLPALGMQTRHYRKFAEALAGEGLQVVLADHPGHGQSPVRAGRGRDWGYRELVEHAQAVHQEVQQEFPDAPFFWVGHSLGGQVALMHAGLAGEGVFGVALVASGTPNFRAWPLFNGAKILMASQILGLAARGLGYLPGDKLGFGKQEAKTLITDWARLARTGRFQFRGLDGDELLNKCETPIHAIQLAGDDWAPQAAIDDLLHRTTSKAVTRWLWQPEVPGLDHNRWPRHPAVPARRTASWIHQQVEQRR